MRLINVLSVDLLAENVGEIGCLEPALEHNINYDDDEWEVMKISISSIKLILLNNDNQHGQIFLECPYFFLYFEMNILKFYAFWAVLPVFFDLKVYFVPQVLRSLLRLEINIFIGLFNEIYVYKIATKKKIILQYNSQFYSSFTYTCLLPVHRFFSLYFMKFRFS